MARLLAGCWKFKVGAGNLPTGSPANCFVSVSTRKSSLLTKASSRSAYHPMAIGSARLQYPEFNLLAETLINA